MPGVTRGGDPAEGWGAEEVVRQVEVRVVEEVEGLGPELQINALVKSSVLQKRHVHVLKSRSLQNIPTRISKSTRRRERKRGGVEPLLRRGIRELRIPDDVGSIIGAETENRPSRSAVVDL